MGKGKVQSRAPTHCSWEMPMLQQHVAGESRAQPAPEHRELQGKGDPAPCTSCPLAAGGLASELAWHTLRAVFQPCSAHTLSQSLGSTLLLFFLTACIQKEGEGEGYSALKTTAG